MRHLIEFSAISDQFRCLFYLYNCFYLSYILIYFFYATEVIEATVFCMQFDLQKSFRLSKHCNIFQAEVPAATKAAELALEFTPLDTHTNIFINSEAAIREIMAVMPSSECVQHFRSQMVELCENIQITIYWVPVRKGIEENERVHELAKAGIRLPRMSASYICINPTRSF